MPFIVELWHARNLVSLRSTINRRGQCYARYAVQLSGALCTDIRGINNYTYRVRTTKSELHLEKSSIWRLSEGGRLPRPMSAHSPYSSVIWCLVNTGTSNVGAVKAVGDGALAGPLGFAIFSKYLVGFERGQKEAYRRKMCHKMR